MAITLAEAKVGYADKVDQQVIDEFRRSSLLLDALTFDDTISPTGGSNLVYGYMRLDTPSTAGVRQINNEYTANEAKRTKQTASPVILGGSFEIDRVIQNTSGAINELDFQIKQKTKAGANYFHNLVINGTSASSGSGYVVNTFDGLKKIFYNPEAFNVLSFDNIWDKGAENTKCGFFVPAWANMESSGEKRDADGRDVKDDVSYMDEDGNSLKDLASEKLIELRNKIKDGGATQ